MVMRTREEKGKEKEWDESEEEMGEARQLTSFPQPETKCLAFLHTKLAGGMPVAKQMVEYGLTLGMLIMVAKLICTDPAFRRRLKNTSLVAFLGVSSGLAAITAIAVVDWIAEMLEKKLSQGAPPRQVKNRVMSVRLFDHSYRNTFAFLEIACASLPLRQRPQKGSSADL